MPIQYALFPNHLTSDPDDFMAVVQNQTTRSKEDIIDEMIGRGSTVTKAEALSVLEEFEAAVERALNNGDSINTPLFRISASVKGVFYNESESFDRSKHYVRLNVNPGSRIGEIAQSMQVSKIAASAPMPTPQNFRDVASDTSNETLTPGGVGEITGSLLKVDEDGAEQGVFFVATDGTTTKSPTLIRNKPGNLIFMIPDSLTSGSYDVEVRVVLKNTKQLRAGRLNYSLIVA